MLPIPEPLIVKVIVNVLLVGIGFEVVLWVLLFVQVAQVRFDVPLVVFAREAATWEGGRGVGRAETDLDRFGGGAGRQDVGEAGWQGL